MFRTYPGSLAGLGLLLLRLALGGSVSIHAVQCLVENGMLVQSAAFFNLIGIISGLAIIVGFLTPIASSITALVVLTLAILNPDACSSPLVKTNFGFVVMLTVSAVIPLLGPGAFSIDAHLFGRRKVIIPRRKNTE